MTLDVYTDLFDDDLDVEAVVPQEHNVGRGRRPMIPGDLFCLIELEGPAGRRGQQ